MDIYQKSGYKQENWLISRKTIGSKGSAEGTQKLVNKNHKIYFVSFFTSVGLMRNLRDREVYACGTVKRGRKDLHKDLNLKKICREENMTIDAQKKACLQ